MQNNKDEIIIWDSNPDYNMTYKEYDKYIILFGSLLSMITNKKLNQCGFVVSLIENKHIQNMFMDISGTDSLYDLLLIIFNRYPKLCTSKTISNKLKKHGRQIRSKYI